MKGIVDKRATEIREILSSRLTPRVALYPLSGDDAPFLFDAFPSLDVVIAIDDHPFVGEFQDLNRLRVREPSVHVGYNDLDVAGGLAPAIWGGLFARFPDVTQISAEATEFRGSRHGWTQFERAGRARTIFQVHISLRDETLRELSSLLQALGVTVDLIFIRASMNQLRANEQVGASILRHLAPGGTLIEGPSGHHMEEEGYEFFGKTLPSTMSAEVVELKNSFGYSAYVGTATQRMRIRLVRRKL